MTTQAVTHSHPAALDLELLLTLAGHRTAAIGYSVVSIDCPSGDVLTAMLDSDDDDTLFHVDIYSAEQWADAQVSHPGDPDAYDVNVLAYDAPLTPTQVLAAVRLWTARG